MMQQLLNQHAFACFILALVIITGIYWIIIATISAFRIMVVAYFNRNKKYHEDDDHEDD
jgi:hypothetical protein